jgi:hypothetical protein
MKFRSPTETPVYMALTTGHTFVVGPELVEVPKMFHRQAVMEGCLPEGMDALPSDDGPPSDTKIDLIVKAIKAMLADPKDGDFNGDGKPDVRKLSARAGFTVLADERNSAWTLINDEDQG